MANESSDEVASPDNVQVDDILYCTSYYDFMISTFYKVLAKRGQSTLVLQRLKKNYTGSQSDGVAEPTDEVDSDYRPITVRYGKHGFKIGGNRLYVWDGTPLEEYNYSESKQVNEGLFSNEHSGVVGDALAKALDNALDKAFDCFDDELRRQGFNGYDGDGAGGFYFNDFENRKTYYVRLGLTHLQECENYEGDAF